MAFKNSLKPNVPEWIKNDAFDVNILEALYGRESSFGQNRRSRNSNGAAGDFQMEAPTARSIGLQVSAKNDERFNLEASSAAAAKYLKSLDNHFRRVSTLTGDTKTTVVKDSEERKKFAIAVYNSGEFRIARAQELALMAEEDPAK